MPRPGSHREPAAPPADVLGRSLRWARLAEWQGGLVHRFGAVAVLAVTTLTACLASLLLSLLIARTFAGPQALQSWENFVLPVVVPLLLVPCFGTPLMHLLEHMRELTISYRYLAEHDPLTGAHNRNGLYRLSDSLDPGTVVVLADIDKFKLVNDEFGHAEGDRVLHAVAEKLRSTFGSEAVIARVGGDEFVVLLASRALQADDVPRELLVSTDATSVRVSVGWGTLTEDLDAAIIDADLAMYRAKPAAWRRLWQHGDQSRPGSSSTDLGSATTIDPGLTERASELPPL